METMASSWHSVSHRPQSGSHGLWLCDPSSRTAAGGPHPSWISRQETRVFVKTGDCCQIPLFIHLQIHFPLQQDFPPEINHPFMVKEKVYRALTVLTPPKKVGVWTINGSSDQTSKSQYLQGQILSQKPFLLNKGYTKISAAISKIYEFYSIFLEDLNWSQAF